MGNMAPNENIAAGSILTTYKVADKAMDIPLVNDVVSGVKKIADPISPYVEQTYNILKDKAKESLSEEVKVECTLGSLGSTIDNLACNGLDQLTTAVPSLKTTTSTELLENTNELMETTKEAAVSYMDTAQEYIASYKVARFGIRVFDAYLSMLESPVSLVSSSISTKVQGVRRHLRAVRRAGARRDGEPCKDGSLLIEMAAVLKLNILLGFLGMQLVKIDDEPLASSPQKDKSGINLDEDEDEEEDPDYVPEYTADDSLEYRSDTEATQESQDVVEAPEEVKTEESDGGVGDESLSEVEQVQEECNTPACEKPKHQLTEVEVVEMVKVSDDEMEEKVEADEIVEEIEEMVDELEDMVNELDDKVEDGAENDECKTPKCVKDEHEGRRFDDKGSEGSSSSSNEED